jgi:hypothetical protein
MVDDKIYMDKEIFNAENIKKILNCLGEIDSSCSPDHEFGDAPGKAIKLINFFVEWMAQTTEDHYNGVPYGNYIFEEYRKLTD